MNHTPKQGPRANTKISRTTRQNKDPRQTQGHQEPHDKTDPTQNPYTQWNVLHLF